MNASHSQLLFQEYPAHIEQLIKAALDAVNPSEAVKRHVQREGDSLIIGPESFTLNQGRVYLVSVGKAAVPMGLAAAVILKNCVNSAIFVTKKSARDWSSEIEEAGFAIDPINFNFFLSGHPIPDEESVRAGTAVFDLLTQTTANDIVIFLISGGASALLAQPLIPLESWQQLTEALLASGCTINELNCVRRQLDCVKGGGLASAAAPAACATLILSDVIGSPLAAIGSGPTVYTEERSADALAILNRYNLEEKLETAVWQEVVTILETDSEPSDKPPRNTHFIVGDLRHAADAVVTKAAQLGFIAETLTTRLEGEAREVGKVSAAIVKDLPMGRCLILGGETTVTLQGAGQGGRNQEMALSAAIALAGWPNRVIVCFATDGEDGPTDSAGSIATGETAVSAHRHQLYPEAFLGQNDSHTFFKQLDDLSGDEYPRHLIRTGSTGTNVNDLLILLHYPDIKQGDNAPRP
jgi:hydroxypyruvate reductase